MEYKGILLAIDSYMNLQVTFPGLSIKKILDIVFEKTFYFSLQILKSLLMENYLET